MSSTSYNEDTFKNNIAHFNRLTRITKFMERQPKNIHIHVKNIIQEAEPIQLNDSSLGVNVNISNIREETLVQIEEYIELVKEQNKVLEGERN